MTRRTALAYNRAAADRIVAAAPSGGDREAVEGQMRLFVRQVDPGAPNGSRRFVGRWPIEQGHKVAQDLAVRFGGQAILIDSSRHDIVRHDLLLERAASSNLAALAAAYRRTEDQLVIGLQLADGSMAAKARRTGLHRNTVKNWLQKAVVIDGSASDDLEAPADAYRGAREDLAAAVRASRDEKASIARQTGLSPNTVRSWRGFLTTMPVQGHNDPDTFDPAR